MIIPCLASASNSTVTQQVTVTVVPGFLHINSPVEKVYQKNNIPVNIQVQTPLDIENIIMIDNSDLSYLCSKCKSIQETRFFSNGKHNLTIQVRFKTGDIIEGSVNFEVDSISDIYIKNSAGLKKATAKDMADYLLHYNFTITHKNETAPDDSCSVRADDGLAVFSGINSTRNKLNFYSITSLEQGQGELSAQSKNKVFSLNFNVKKTLENSESFLRLDIEGKSKKEKAVLEYDKKNEKIKITGENFSFNNMSIYFVKGCSARRESFYLLEKTVRVSRSIEEVRELLNNNPIFIEKQQSLNVFYTTFWWRFASLLV